MGCVHAARRRSRRAGGLRLSTPGGSGPTRRPQPLPRPARAVLAIQAQAPPGALAPELEVEANFRFVVHQASGMVAVQLGVGVGEALICLRAYAFANDRPVTEVAEDVVGRRLRFDEGGRGAQR